MTTFTATKYFADQPIPASPNPGTLLYWDDTFITTAAGVVLTTGDSVKMVRMPTGHKPTKLQIYTDGDPDTGGTSLAVNIGSTADADLLAAAYVLTAADTLHVFPQTDIDGIASGSAKFNAAFFSTAAPSTDYDLILVPTANATTLTSATFRFRLEYAASAALKDPTNSPSVVTS